MDIDLLVTECDDVDGELRRKLCDRLSSGQLDLPVLPEVVVQLLSVVDDPDYDASRLAKLIHRDQSIASHLLRISNSTKYSPASPIVSLHQAIARLGIRKILEIVLIISCKNRVFSVKAFEKEVRISFRRSLAAAAFAQEIARVLRSSVEEAFLFGLLHDIGRPVLLQTIADLQSQTGCKFDRTAVISAVEEFRISVGSDLIRRWNLPQRVAEAVRYQEMPADAPNCVQAAQLTNYSIALARFALEPEQIDAEEISTHPSISPLNLYPDQVAALIGKRDEIIAWIESSA